MKILRVKDIVEMTGISRVTIWRMERRGEFPQRMQLSDSGRSVGWMESDIKDWMQSRKEKAAEVTNA